MFCANPMSDKEYYTQEEVVKFLSEAQMYINLKKAIKRYGLEGTEEKVKELYKLTPKLKDYLLKVLHDIWRRVK